MLYGLWTSVGSVSFTSLVQARGTGDLRGLAFTRWDVLRQSGGRLLSLFGGRLLLTLGACGGLPSRRAAPVR